MISPLDDAFRALAYPERRQLLLALADHNPQQDNSFDYPDNVPFDSRKKKKNIHIRMTHQHLPMLEAAGFIEWHEDDQEITTGPNFDVLRPLLEVIDEVTDRVGANNGL